MTVVLGAVAAEAFHEHSYAGDSSAGAYTGLSTWREEGSFSLPTGGNNCTSPYSPYPVYQTMWLLFNGTNWLELGTGHQRGPNGYCRYRFWGYGANGVWHSVGTQILGSGTAPGTRTILGIRPPSSCSATSRCWEYRVGGAVLDRIKWTWTGAYVEAGLESWNAGAIAYSHSYESLLYKSNDGPWTSWSGFDFQYVGVSMCGHWDGANWWQASENSPC